MKTEKINIGNFTETGTWRKPTAVKGGKGNTVRTYADYKTDLVSLVSVLANEAEVSARMQDVETVLITAHFDSNITNTHQFIYNNDTYNLLHTPTPINLKRFMRVKARRIEE